jgi:hypothetical protein
MQQLTKQPAFELGQIVATPGALAALEKAGQPGEFLTRHVNREWGDLSDEDRKENDYSLELMLLKPQPRLVRWRAQREFCNKQG